MAKSVLRFTAAVLITAAIFVALSFLWFRVDLKGVDAPKTDVPYEPPTPILETNVLFVFSNTEGVMVSLDFENETASALILTNPTPAECEAAGYTVDKTVYGDYLFIMKFTDALGGLTLDGYCRTGVQICNMLETDKSTALRREMLYRVFEKLSQTGFSKELFLCIIEETQTDISYPDCVDASPYLMKMCQNGRVIN